MRLAFETGEAALRAENWFFETVRAELVKTAELSEFPTVMGSNGHDYPLHFAQFLFFLKALDCTDDDRIANCIEADSPRLEDGTSAWNDLAAVLMACTRAWSRHCGAAF